VFIDTQDNYEIVSQRLHPSYCCTSDCDVHFIIWVNSVLVTSVVLLFTLLSYYGLQLWFPEYFKNLIDDKKGNDTKDDDYNNCTNTDTKPYKDSLYEASASVPGNFIGLFVINIIGGKLLLSESVPSRKLIR